jgi:hypothetical protein
MKKDNEEGLPFYFLGDIHHQGCLEKIEYAEGSGESVGAERE